MKNILKCGVLLGVLSLGAFGQVTVTNLNQDWVLLPNSIGPTSGTWGMPAVVPGCGAENELTCETTGNWVVNKGFTAAPGYFTITDQAGGISDYILFGNDAGGSGHVFFYSDPNLNPNLNGFTNDGVLCNEGSGNGCSGTFALTLTGGGTLSISAASDAEAVFDPFGFGFDTSDQIQFNGAQPIAGVPEPGSIALLGTVLLGTVAGLRRRFVKG